MERHTRSRSRTMEPRTRSRYQPMERRTRSRSRQRSPMDPITSHTENLTCAPNPRNPKLSKRPTLPHSPIHEDEEHDNDEPEERYEDTSSSSGVIESCESRHNDRNSSERTGSPISLGSSETDFDFFDSPISLDSTHGLPGLPVHSSPNTGDFAEYLVPSTTRVEAHEAPDNSKLGDTASTGDPPGPPTTPSGTVPRQSSDITSAKSPTATSLAPLDDTSGSEDVPSSPTDERSTDPGRTLDVAPATPLHDTTIQRPPPLTWPSPLFTDDSNAESLDDAASDSASRPQVVTESRHEVVSADQSDGQDGVGTSTQEEIKEINRTIGSRAHQIDNSPDHGIVVGKTVAEVHKTMIEDHQRAGEPQQEGTNGPRVNSVPQHGLTFDSILTSPISSVEFNSMHETPLQEHHSNTSPPRLTQSESPTIQPAEPTGTRYKIVYYAGADNGYDVMRLVGQRYFNLKFKITVLRNKKDEVVVPFDGYTETRLSHLTARTGSLPGFTPLDPQLKPHKGVMTNFPSDQPLTAVTDHPKISKAMWLRSKHGRTRPVHVVHQGPLPKLLHLGDLGSFTLKNWGPEPVRCYKCQRFGHYRYACDFKDRCGVCSGPHPTNDCLRRHRNHEKTTARCPNCKRSHHAWHPECPARLARLRPSNDIYCKEDSTWDRDRSRPVYVDAPQPSVPAWGNPANMHMAPRHNHATGSLNARRQSHPSPPEQSTTLANLPTYVSTATQTYNSVPPQPRSNKNSSNRKRGLPVHQTHRKNIRQCKLAATHQREDEHTESQRGRTKRTLKTRQLNLRHSETQVTTSFAPRQNRPLSPQEMSAQIPTSWSTTRTGTQAVDESPAPIPDTNTILVDIYKLLQSYQRRYNDKELKCTLATLENLFKYNRVDVPTTLIQPQADTAGTSHHYQGDTHYRQADTPCHAS